LTTKTATDLIQRIKDVAFRLDNYDVRPVRKDILDLLDLEPLTELRYIWSRVSILNALMDEYDRIWKLLPPETWKMYKDMGEDDFREVLLLAEALKNLRKAVKQSLFTAAGKRTAIDQRYYKETPVE
jgi:hypothetical protein